MGQALNYYTLASLTCFADIDISNATATGKAQTATASTQRMTQVGGPAFHRMDVVEPHGTTNPVHHCLTCWVLLCLRISVAILGLAVGIWRCYKADEVTGFTVGSFVVGVGLVLVKGVQEWHNKVCHAEQAP